MPATFGRPRFPPQTQKPRRLRLRRGVSLGVAIPASGRHGSRHPAQLLTGRVDLPNKIRACNY